MELNEYARALVSRGIRDSTAKTYSAAQRRYLEFCCYHSTSPMPATEDLLLAYIARLNIDGLKASSIRVYLSAVRAMHIDEGYGNPIENCFRITKALRGLDMVADPPKQKLPITFPILCKMKAQVPQNYNGMVVWCAMTVAFFGCLRAAELAPGSSFNPACHLCVCDLTFSQIEGRQCAIVIVKHSKTDTKNVGFRLYISCTGVETCGYCALLTMLKWRFQHGITMDDSTPLFLFANGDCLTKSTFKAWTKSLLLAIGMDASQFSGHSYRAGSATTAALCGLSDHEIKLLGRWSSSAYQRYIRAPEPLLASFSSRLATPQSLTGHLPIPWQTYCKNILKV